MFCKDAKKKDTGTILLGFATLMFGMETMSGAVSGLSQVPAFTNLFLAFRNPILGVLVGAVLTWSLTDAVFPHLNASFWVFGGQVALGEIAVLGVLGLPLMRLLPRNPKFREIIRSYQKE